jgi:hypothetical protein
LFDLIAGQMVKFYCGVSVLGPCQANQESCLPPHPVIIGISALNKQLISGAASAREKIKGLCFTGAENQGSYF